MKKSLSLAGALFLSANAVFAQTPQQLPAPQDEYDVFLVDHILKTIGFKISDNTAVDDHITITNSKGELVRDVTITSELLRKGGYAIRYNELASDDYTIKVTGAGVVKHMMMFKSATEPVVTVKAHEQAVKGQPFSFNPEQGAFTFGVAGPVKPGALMVIYDAHEQALATQKVTEDMVRQQLYTVAAGALPAGKYSVTLDGKPIGTASYVKP